MTSWKNLIIRLIERIPRRPGRITTEENSDSSTITFGMPIGIPYAYKKLAVDSYKQSPQLQDTGYYLAFLFLHMHIEDLLFQNFATILFASRAGISTAFALDESGRKSVVSEMRRGNIENQLESLARHIGQVDIQNYSGDTSLLTPEEKPYLTRFISVRNYLTHASSMNYTPLRRGGSTTPIQSGNANDDLVDAFRMMQVLEHRLTSALGHIESTLFTGVCSGYAHTEKIVGEGFISFTFHVFESPDSRFRTVVSRSSWPMTKISEISQAWSDFENYRYHYWPVGELESSIDDALEKSKRIIEKEYPHRHISPMKRVDSTSGPPAMNERDWPWEPISLNHDWTNSSLKNLIGLESDHQGGA